jgi:hypothetical protein
MATVLPRLPRSRADSGLYEVQVTIQTPFPGTPLYRRLKDEERLLSDDPWEKCTLFDVTFRPHRMSVEELEKGFRSLVRELYAVEATHQRRHQFREARDISKARVVAAADLGAVAARNKT